MFWLKILWEIFVSIYANSSNLSKFGNEQATNAKTYFRCYEEILGCRLFTGSADHNVKDSSLIYRIHSLHKKNSHKQVSKQVTTKFSSSLELTIYTRHTGKEPVIRFWCSRYPGDTLFDHLKRTTCFSKKQNNSLAHMKFSVVFY